MNERNKNSLGAKIFTYLIFLFLYLPIIVLIVFSFNDSKSRTVWSGFTFDWYAKLFHNDRIIGALQNTLLVSILAAVIATLIGTFASTGPMTWSTLPICFSDIGYNSFLIGFKSPRRPRSR